MKNNISDVPSEDTSGIGQDHYPEGQVITKSPWNPNILYLLTFFGGFGATGIIAGINYKRLGKPHLKWPTIVISLIIFILMVIGQLTVPIEIPLWFMGNGYASSTYFRTLTKLII